MLNLLPMFLQGEKVKYANYPVVNYDKGIGGWFVLTQRYNVQRK